MAFFVGPVKPASLMSVMPLAANWSSVKIVRLAVLDALDPELHALEVTPAADWLQSALITAEVAFGGNDVGEVGGVV